MAAATADGMIGDDPDGAIAVRHQAISDSVDRRCQAEIAAMISPGQRRLFEGLPPERRSLDGMALLAFSPAGGETGGERDDDPGPRDLPGP